MSNADKVVIIESIELQANLSLLGGVAPSESNPLYDRYGLPATSRFPRFKLNVSTGTTTVIVAGAALMTAKIYRMLVNVAAAQTMDIQGTGGVSLCGGPLTFAAGGGLVLDFLGEPWFESPVGEGLQIVTTTTGAMRGVVDYVRS